MIIQTHDSPRLGRNALKLFMVASNKWNYNGLVTIME